MRMMTNSSSLTLNTGLWSKVLQMSLLAVCKSVIAFELPDGRDPVESIQNKLDEIKAVIESKEKDDNLVSNAQSVQSVQSVQSIQKVQNVQNGNQWKNNKNNKSNKMYYPSGKNNSNKNVK